jgi:hypothetical protein
MVLLGNVCQLEGCFGLFGDSRSLFWSALGIVLIFMQQRCTLCTERTRARKSFRAHLKVHLGDVGQVEAHFSSFGDSVNLGAC